MGELVERGYSAADIAKLTGLHVSSVRDRLRRHMRDDSWKHRPRLLEQEETMM